jgi:hypothetical protein
VAQLSGFEQRTNADPNLIATACRPWLSPVEALSCQNVAFSGSRGVRHGQIPAAAVVTGVLAAAASSFEMGETMFRKRLSVCVLAAMVLTAALPSTASAAEQRIRIVTASEPLKISKDDELIGLKRSEHVKPMPAYLPPDARPGQSIVIQDLSWNSGTYPVTVFVPKGMTIRNGKQTSVINFHGARAIFTFFGDGIWSSSQ